MIDLRLPFSAPKGAAQWEVDRKPKRTRMSQSFDPIDLFEIALQRGTATGGNLVGLGFSSALEFSALRYSRWRDSGEDLISSFPELERWPALTNLRALAAGCELLQPDQSRSLAYTQGPIRPGIKQFGTSPKDWEPGGILTQFQEQFRTALRSQGVGSGFASALAGALQEMMSNAAEHAVSPVRPVACFEVGQGTWALSVVDVGRGVLASLRENPRHKALGTEGEALEQALQPGVSRLPISGRGMGFSRVFKSLVDRRAVLRFRSGGAVATWEGVSPTHQTIHARALPVRSNGFRVRLGGPFNGA